MNEPRKNGLKVLTFDGEADIRVGVQSSLYTLLDMMRRAAYDHPELTAGETNANSSNNSIPEALPCKCFDLIVGSGDGGWIAIMLGRLHMSTSQVIRTYLQVRASVHDSYPYNGPVNTWNPDAMSTAFENQLKLIVINRDEGADETFQVQTPSCHVVALAVHKESDAPYAACFRNYVTRIDSLPNCTTWFAMRAVASSMLFPPALISSTGQKIVSASQLNFNNPVLQAISEAIHLAKRLNITNPPLACLVSLGAGHPGVREIDVSELGNTAIRLTQGAELAHRQVQERLRAETNLSGSKATYFRVNVDQGFQTDSSQQITRAEIYTHSKTYLQQPEIEDRMNEIVKHVLGASEDVTTLIPLEYYSLGITTPDVAQSNTGMVNNNSRITARNLVQSNLSTVSNNSSVRYTKHGRNGTDEVLQPAIIQPNTSTEAVTEPKHIGAIIRNDDLQQSGAKQKSTRYPVTFEEVGERVINPKSPNKKGTKNPNTAISISTETTLQSTAQLHNYLQAANRPTILSWTQTVRGDKHAPVHTCQARIHGNVRGTGKATQKKTAKDKAAIQTLNWLRANEGKW
ncbi:hypothetical protein DL96DRAFT_1722400 [Flagelloscypha sp. PMI_526]|nr:hypothetical protein DL96DRAFT_1722400 [Flagelloscypha sp. PMI_526]